MSSEITEGSDSAQESVLWNAAQAGTVVNLKSADETQNDPKDGAKWPEARLISGETVGRLLRRAAAQRLSFRGLKIHGARIGDQLDLEDVDISAPLAFIDCSFETAVNLRSTRARRILFRGSFLPGLDGTQLDIHGDLDLNGAFRCEGEVRLYGAHIVGVLRCAGSFVNPDALAVFGDGLRVEQDAILRATFDGTVRLVGAYVGGQLLSRGAKFRNHGKDALLLDGTVVDQDLMVEQDTEFDGAFRLLGSRIGGQLVTRDARFANAGGRALVADGSKIRQDLHLAGDFAGEVHLLGVHVGGQVLLSGNYRNSGGVAIAADRLRADGGIHFRNGFVSDGEVDMLGARIRPELSVDGSFNNPKGRALDLEAATIKGGVHMLPSHFAGGLDLTNARANHYVDSQATWPAKGAIWLQGFSYDAIAARPEVKLKQRIDWVTRNATGYSPQPFDELASAHRRAGDEQQAIDVGIAKLRSRRSRLNVGNRFLDFIFDKLIAYGYHTGRAVWWLAALLLTGSYIFASAARDGQITPAGGSQASDFNALAYSADWIVPVLGLHQREAWTAHGVTQWLVLALAAIGWILTTAVVLGITGILKRDSG